jgi:hypothetical protein
MMGRLIPFSKMVIALSLLVMVVVAGIGYAFFGRHGVGLEAVRVAGATRPQGVAAQEFVHLSATPNRGTASDSEFVLPDHYTVIVYHQETCPDCRRLDGQLATFITLRKDVVVRKIDLGKNWSSKQAMLDFGRRIWWTPFVVVYGTDGRLLVADDGGKRDAGEFLQRWMQEELANSKT